MQSNGADTVASAVQTAPDTVASAVQTAPDTLATAVQTGDPLTALVQPVQGLTDATVEPVGALVTTVAQPASTTIQPLSEVTAPLIEPLADGLLAPVIQPVGGLTGPVLQPVGQVTGSLTQPLGESLAPVVQPVAELTSPVLQSTSQLTSPVLQPLGESLAPVLQPVGGLTGPVLQPVGQMTGPAVQPFGEALAPFIQPVDRIVPGSSQGLGGSGEAVFGTVTPITDALGQPVFGVGPGPLEAVPLTADTLGSITRPVTQDGEHLGALIVAPPDSASTLGDVVATSLQPVDLPAALWQPWIDPGASQVDATMGASGSAGGSGLIDVVTSDAGTAGLVATAVAIVGVAATRAGRASETVSGCVAAVQVAFPSIRLIPCQVASVTARTVSIGQTAASSISGVAQGSGEGRGVLRPPRSSSPVPGGIRDAIPSAISAVRPPTAQLDWLKNSRLLMQIGMLLATVYLGFLSVWFAAADGLRRNGHTSYAGSSGGHNSERRLQLNIGVVLSLLALVAIVAYFFTI